MSKIMALKMARIRRQVETGKITMAEAEEKAKPYMMKLNVQAALEAHKKGETYEPINFEGFMWIWRENEKRDNPK